MNALKRMAKALLAAVVFASLTITTFASTPKYSLTVTSSSGALEGKNVYLYRIFDMDNSGDYNYVPNNNYLTAVQTALGSSNTGYELYQDLAAAVSEDITATANLLMREVIEVGVGSYSEAYYSSGIITAENKNSYTFASVAPGYYLVYLGGSVSINASLVSVTENSTIAIKSELPTLTKTADKSSAMLGDRITYTVKFKIPDPAGYKEKYQLKLVDTMGTDMYYISSSDSLTKVTDTLPVAVSIDDQSNGNVNAAVSQSNGVYTFTADLSSFVSTDNAGKTMTLTYYAKLGKNAGLDNTNSAYLQYSHMPTIPGQLANSAKATVTVHSYPLNIHKASDADPDGFLGEIGFTLYYDCDGTKGEAVHLTGENGVYRVAVNGDKNVKTEMTTHTTSVDLSQKYNISLHGLAAGDYWLSETNANGYTPMQDIKITVKPGYSYVVDGIDRGNVLKIINTGGTPLPDTGDHGALVLYTAGSMIVAAAAVILCHSKSKEKKEEVDQKY